MVEASDPLKAFVIGTIQALTEFLPVSSSGHMVVVKHLLHVTETGITIEIVTHLATALAVIIFLRRQLVRLVRSLLVFPFRRSEPQVSEDVSLIGKLAVASVPAGLLGLSVRSQIEGFFSNPVLTAAMLIVTGCYLLVSGLARKGSKSITYRHALIIGLAQAAALVPGISRSGLTIGAALLIGVEARRAFEFSLLLSLPAIIGAGIVELVSERLAASTDVIMASTLAAFGFGYLAIMLLFRTVIRRRLHIFSFYLIPLGILLLIVL